MAPGRAPCTLAMPTARGSRSWTQGALFFQRDAAPLEEQRGRWRVRPARAARQLGAIAPSETSPGVSFGPGIHSSSASSFGSTTGAPS